MSFGTTAFAFLCVIAGVCLGALLLFMEIVSKTFRVGTSILGSYGLTSGNDHIIMEMAEEIKRLKEALKAPGRFRGSNWMMPTPNQRTSRLRL